MKIAILSDIHGNFPALQAVLNDIKQYSCEKIYNLGDIAGYYCMLNECITLIQEYQVISLMGNHDYYLYHNQKCPRSTTANLCLDYQKSIILPNSLAFFQTLLTQYDDGLLSLRHGGWHDPLDEYVNSCEFDGCLISDAQYYCSGHTHRQVVNQSEEYYYVNPGSVGQPRDGDYRAAYAIIDLATNQIELKRIEYDIDFIVSEMKQAGFDTRIAECLYYGERIGFNDFE